MHQFVEMYAKLVRDLVFLGADCGRNPVVVLGYKRSDFRTSFSGVYVDG